MKFIDLTKKVDLEDLSTSVTSSISIMKTDESEIDIGKLIGSAMLLDLVVLDSLDGEICATKLEEAEMKQGLYLQEGDILLLRTNAENKARLRGSAIEWLEKKQLSALGFDCDVTQCLNEEALQRLGLLDTVIMQNLTNLSDVSTFSRFTFVGLPMRVNNSKVVPLRAIVLNDSQFIN